MTKEVTLGDVIIIHVYIPQQKLFCLKKTENAQFFVDQRIIFGTADSSSNS